MNNLEFTMRPVSSRVALWMSVLSILVALFAFESLTFAQTNSPSKRDLVLPGNQLVYGQMFGSRLASARLGQGNGPQTGTDTWTGGGGSNTDWSDTSNWNNGSPSGQ